MSRGVSRGVLSGSNQFPLSGIKDKLPGGRYVVLVSMYDRIGGHVMRWSNLTGQQWSGSTLPLSHDGAFHSIELPVSPAALSN